MSLIAQPLSQCLNLPVFLGELLLQFGHLLVMGILHHLAHSTRNCSR